MARRVPIVANGLRALPGRLLPAMTGTTCRKNVSWLLTGWNQDLPEIIHANKIGIIA